MESNTRDRELLITQVLNAPIVLVWDAWTKPGHIAKWWGPNGFTCTINVMNVEPGGEWNLILHGPDGTDYKNKSIFKEIVPHKKIVYDHISAPKFLTTITFEAQDEQTLLKWHMLFESHEQFVQVIEVFKAGEGLKQNVERMMDYLSSVR